MTTLYNCKHDGDEFRITKFDADMNIEASYLLTREECECPAGHRPTCRHRQMLPKFLNRNAVGTDWFYDYDRNGWVQSKLEFELTDQVAPTPDVESTDQVSEPKNDVPVPLNRRGF